MVVGGFACILGVGLSMARTRKFAAYDSRQPAP